MKLFVDGRTDGHFPLLILLGRLLEVDLMTNAMEVIISVTYVQTDGWYCFTLCGR